MQHPEGDKVQQIWACGLLLQMEIFKIVHQICRFTHFLNFDQDWNVFKRSLMLKVIFPLGKVSKVKSKTPGKFYFFAGSPFLSIYCFTD